MTGTIGVCITTFNRAAGLDRTLASLAEQTVCPDELIVSDDASTDGTADVVARWRSVFPQLTYQRNPANLYMPGNLNAAVSRIHTDYVANLHDGDTCDPRLLEKWRDALDRYPGAGFVFCAVAFDTAGGHRVVVIDAPPISPGRTFFECYFLQRWASVVWGTVMARRSAYDALLPFDPQFGFYSDVDMWMRMCLDHDVAYVAEPLLVLDDTLTRERRPSWQKAEVTRRMQQVNISRHFAHDPDRLNRELRRHVWGVRRHYLRLLLIHLKWRNTEELRRATVPLLRAWCGPRDAATR